MNLIRKQDAWRKEPFRFIAAPFTPMQPDGMVQTERIPRYYEMLAENNISGAFINGSTGEGVSMSLEEKKTVTLAWARATAGKPNFKVINLMGGNSLSECIELARFSRQHGIDHISVIPPFYFKPADVAQLAQFVARLYRNFWYIITIFRY